MEDLILICKTHTSRNEKHRTCVYLLKFTSPIGVRVFFKSHVADVSLSCSGMGVWCDLQTWYIDHVALHCCEMNILLFTLVSRVVFYLQTKAKQRNDFSANVWSWKDLQFRSYSYTLVSPLWRHCYTIVTLLCCRLCDVIGIPTGKTCVIRMRCCSAVCSTHCSTHPHESFCFALSFSKSRKEVRWSSSPKWWYRWIAHCSLHLGVKTERQCILPCTCMLLLCTEFHTLALELHSSVNAIIILSYLTLSEKAPSGWGDCQKENFGSVFLTLRCVRFGNHLTHPMQYAHCGGTSHRARRSTWSWSTRRPA